MRHFLRVVEQLHVRSMNCRTWRLELVAGLGIALAMLSLPGVAIAQSARTETTLAVTAGGTAGQTHATVSVTEDNGAPASGIVAIEEGGRQLASVALNSSGQADTTIDLPSGAHTLSAVYLGDATLQSSVSRPQTTTTTTSTTPDFQVAVSSLQPSSTLAAGSAGTALVTVTPVNNAALTAPMFITLSCSGLPDQASCTFTPTTVEIVATTPTSCAAGSPASACPPTSSIVVQTQGPGTAGHGATSMLGPTGPGRGPTHMEWALLFPGILGLGGLAWGTRRRRWLSRILVLAAVGVMTVMGTTACNPQYHYYHNGQPVNLPTPAGSYTVTVTAQSSNGITAITHSTPLAMTVQ
jgi:hypothetical protein